MKKKEFLKTFVHKKGDVTVIAVPNSKSKSPEVSSIALR